jgi:3-deoxy-manno-octulosonate cytidylyltransferase (CMP-KDO synthetase)
VKLGAVRLLASDVDGVLTDGTLYYGPAGEALKSFHVRDGLGVRQLLENGVEVALITGRNDAAVARRAEELGIRHVRVGRDDKWAALEEIMAALGLGAEDVAYVGDDVQDLPVLRRVGLAIAVADAHPSVRAAVHWVTEAAGGRGAIREIADRLLAKDDFRVVIPARFGSTRLPGKPLRLIAGRPMIAHVWDRAVEAGASEILVATDDDRIREAVEAFGGRAIMTATTHASGTDRLAEVAARLGWRDDAVVVNLQGDEPLMPASALRAAVDALRAQPQAGIATLATPIREEADVADRNVVKVVVNDARLACWFSRSPISRTRHLGLYVYRVGVLKRIAAEPPRPEEKAESLEQLRALAMGIGIAVQVLDSAPVHGVDTEADLRRVEDQLR